MLTNYNTFPPFNYCSTSATCQFIAKSLCAIERSCDHGKIVRYIGIAVFMQTVYYRFILTDIVHLYSSPDQLLHTAEVVHNAHRLLWMLLSDTYAPLISTCHFSFSLAVQSGKQKPSFSYLKANSCTAIDTVIYDNLSTSSRSGVMRSSRFVCQQFVLSVCLSVCLSVSSVTAKVRSRFHWNLVLWLCLPIGRTA